MAKKTVASLQTKSKRLTKAIKMVRSEKSRPHKAIHGQRVFLQTIIIKLEYEF